MRTDILSAATLLFGILGISSCEQEEMPDNRQGEMRFEFSMPEQSRATETEFENGDKVGLFVCESALPLEPSGNIVNNERMSFDGNSWTSDHKLYWDDGTFNAYAYYPYTSPIQSVNEFPFEVHLDQRGAKTGDSLGGFEASDFLFASKKGITSSGSPIVMNFRHIMSRLTIRLVKGEDYEGELPDDATVYIHNTVTSATIDLAAGVATPQQKGERNTVTAKKSAAQTYTAIIVPQRLQNRVPLIEVEMNGVSLLYESKFLFRPGVHHLVNLILDKNPEQIKIDIGGEITGWN